MKKIIRIVLYFSLILNFIGSCKKKYDKREVNFQTYHQVDNYLNSNNFKVDETTETNNSSFITSAHFQSEDGKKGYLTLGMRGKKYHFDDVPFGVWERFKNAESKGKFYHSDIKGKYNIIIKQ